ncbi:hypothetical protein FZ103_10570 [Streptomonospora sp. PA3]|uniref:hypothetical protein n=1 Tax=Streptomonospora sp. PA3 TaxID=2607326 RepID=UPI0012DD0D21|nr:hypothetical protein [Streptomonospora sp. PA3]MUL41614.1 hypothetical protein [Streptomonospora sp. PA3]
MTVETTEAVPVRDRVAQALAARPEGTTAVTLVEATGASRASVSKALSALEKSGRARRRRPDATEATRPLPDTWFPSAPPPGPEPAEDTIPETETEVGAAPADAAPTAAEAAERPQRRTQSGRPVARPGQLRAMVAQHLIEHPHAEFTPGEISKVLNRSAGAIANALEKLAETGEARRTCAAPRRYQAAAPDTAEE